MKRGETGTEKSTHEKDGGKCFWTEKFSFPLFFFHFCNFISTELSERGREINTHIHTKREKKYVHSYSVAHIIPAHHIKNACTYANAFFPENTAANNEYFTFQKKKFSIAFLHLYLLTFSLLLTSWAAHFILSLSFMFSNGAMWTNEWGGGASVASSVCTQRVCVCCVCIAYARFYVKAEWKEIIFILHMHYSHVVVCWSVIFHFCGATQNCIHNLASTHTLYTHIHIHMYVYVRQREELFSMRNERKKIHVMMTKTAFCVEKVIF